MVTKKILVVDYDQALLSSLHKTLSDEGFQVVLAADGKTAWDKYHQDNPDLVLMEAMLSKIHGFELCERITKQAARKVPVIIMTGVYRDRVYRTEALRTYGASEYFEKPLNLSEVLASIQALLATNGGGQKSEKPFEVKTALGGGPANGGTRNVQPASAPPPQKPAPATTPPAKAEDGRKPASQDLQARPAPGVIRETEAKPAPAGDARAPSDGDRKPLRTERAAAGPPAKPVAVPGPAAGKGSGRTEGAFPSPSLARTLQDLNSLEKELSSIARPVPVKPGPQKTREAEKAGEDVDLLLKSTLADFGLGQGKRKKAQAAPPPRPQTPAPPQDIYKPSEPAQAVREIIKPVSPPQPEPAAVGRPEARILAAPETLPEPPAAAKPAVDPVKPAAFKPVVTTVAGTPPAAPALAPQGPKPEPVDKPAAAPPSVKQAARLAVPLTERPLDGSSAAGGPVEVVSRALAEAAKDLPNAALHSKLFKDIYEPEKKKTPALVIGIAAAVVIIGLAAFLALRPKPAPARPAPKAPAEQSMPAVLEKTAYETSPAETEVKPGTDSPEPVAPAAKTKPPVKPPASEADIIIPKAVTEPRLVAKTPGLKPEEARDREGGTGSGQAARAQPLPSPSSTSEAAAAEGPPPAQAQPARNGESRTAEGPPAAGSDATSAAAGRPKAQTGDLVPVEEADAPPEVLKTVNPKYPAQALRFGREGSITVNALVNEAGDVLDTAILKGMKDDMGLEPAAEAAVRKWKFKPAVKDGVNVKTWMPIVVTFKKGQAGIATEIKP